MATTKKKSGATITLRRTGSPIRRESDQRATLVGLGLTRANKVVELEDTSAVQGMVRKVRHLIEIVK